MTVELFSSGVCLPRNSEIMRFFHDVEMVEQLGSGMNRILRYYDKSIFEIHDDMIKVVFRFVPGFEDDLQSNLDSKSDSGLKSTERLSRAEIKIRIVEVLKEDPLCTYETLSKMFNISRATVANYMKSLNEAGEVKRVGSDKDGHWDVLKHSK